MNDRWVPLGIESITDDGTGEYTGYRIRFVQTKYGVTARLIDPDGYVADIINERDFMEAYVQASTQWPGAGWKNKEEE